MLAMEHAGGCGTALGVVPVLVGPLQVLLVLLPGVIIAVLSLLLSLFKPRVMKHGLKVLWRMKLPLAIILVCGGGIVWAAKSFWPDFGPPPGHAEASVNQWPIHRGGLARRGAVLGTSGPTRGRVNWRYNDGDAAFYSSPAVVGNRVYVASARFGVFADSGAILCFDADTGALVWRSAPDGYRATFSSPVVSGRYLVCGEGLHMTRNALVVCLDLGAGREGDVLWTYRTSSHVECAPVISNGRVYVGAGDDGYYCFELEPGPDGQAQVVWHQPGEKYPDAETSLTVHDGKVYAGLGLGGKAICVLDADTGEELKRIPTPYPVFSPPAIADGKLYVGMGNGNVVNKAEEIQAKPAGEVWCIDLATLRVDWKFRVGRTVLGAVAVAGDEVYFGSRDGHLYAVGRDGKFIGKWNAHGPIVASPAVTDTRVYCITNSGTLYGLDRSTLEPVWEVVLGTEPLFISSPTVARARVYVGTQSDGFVCVGEPGEERQTPVWPGHLGGPGKAGHLDGSPLPRLGAFRWQYPADQLGETEDAYVTAPVAALEGNICVPLDQGPNRGVACLPAKPRADETPKAAWFYETRNGVSRSPAISGNNMLLVDGKPGDVDRRLHCVDRANGAIRWQAPVESEASGALIVTAEHLFVQDAADSLSCFGMAGKRVWSHSLGWLDRAPAVTESMLVAATAAPATLVALDRPTGRQLWRVALEAPPRTSPTVDKSAVYLGTARGLEARSLVDGAPLPGWKIEGGGVSGDFALARSAIAYVNDRGELIVLARAGGKIVARVGGALPGTTPVLNRDIVLYASEDGLMRFAPHDPQAKPTVWMETSWLGKPTTPMVMSGSKIYVGMAGWGVVCLGAGR